MTIFKMALKRILGQPVNWLLILLFPVAFSLMISVGNNPDVDAPGFAGSAFPIGVVDQDGSALSQALVSQLDTRFMIREMQAEDITAALTGQEVAWALVIREGYGSSVLAGTAPVIDGYSLATSEVGIIAGRTTENITRALMILGTDDPAALAQWAATSRIEITVMGDGSNWASIGQILGMYGFVAMFAGFFVVRTLLDDKLKGMPQRLGVLPVSPRRLLAESTFAAFVVTILSALALMLAIHRQFGTIPNPMHLFMILCMFNLFSVTFVRAVASGVKNMGLVSVIVTMGANIFAMVGGLFWPLELVPPFMQRLAWFSPGYWLSRGMRGVPDISFEGFVMPVLFLGAFTAVTVLLGGWQNIQAEEE